MSAISTFLDRLRSIIFSGIALVAVLFVVVAWITESWGAALVLAFVAALMLDVFTDIFSR